MNNLENSNNCNRKNVNENEIYKNNQNGNEQDENEKDENENEQDEIESNENEQDENEENEKECKKNQIKEKTNSNENDIIYPIGLNNFLYEKNNGYFLGYNSYEMTTGNICYMNSSIQCLFHLKDFTDNITKIASHKKGDLINATSNLIEEMKNKNSDVLSVKNIKNAMGKIDERYKDNNQEDANEFISNFLDGLLDEIGDKNNLPKPLDIKNELDRAAYDKFYNRFYKIKGNSFLLDLFYSIIKTEKKCKKCKKSNSIKFNTNNIIELPIKSLVKGKNDIYLPEVIANYKKNENITGECKFCHHGKIYEETNIYSLPKYLILYFGRTVGNKYISNQILFPEKCDFTNNASYRITSVIYHSQLDKKTGHYTASCKCDNNIWYYFNDSYAIKEKEKESIENFNNKKHLKPIILIYEKI